MDCPRCQSPRISMLQRKTNLGYAMFRCKQYWRTSNEQTDTPFNFIKVSTDIIFQILLCRVRYKLSYPDVSGFCLLKDFQLFSHKSVRDWKKSFPPHFTEQIRAKRKGKVDRVRLADETYVKDREQWCYLYQGINEDRNLVDVRLSKTRDMAGTVFFAQAIEFHEDSPEKVANDGLASYLRTVKEELIQEVEYEMRPYTANPVEQSHRTVKHRYYPTLGFGEFEAAQGFCRAVDGVGIFLRSQMRMAELVLLRSRRRRFVKGVEELEALFQAA